MLSELIRHGRVRRGFIGIAGQTIAVPRRHALAADIGNASGAMITTIEQGAPADTGGLMTLDVIVRVDGEKVTGVDDLIRLLNADRIGRTVTFDVLRRGLLRQFDVTRPSALRRVRLPRRSRISGPRVPARVQPTSDCKGSHLA